MTHPTYAWMFYNWYSDNWWEVSKSSCTVEQIKSFLDYSLVFDHYPRINDSDKDKLNVADMVRSY